MTEKGVTVGVTSNSFSKHPLLRERLQQIAPQVRFNETGAVIPRQQLPEFLSGCQAAVVGLEKIDEGILQQCPNLKLIAKYGVGLDNLDLEACKRHNVQIGWRAGVNAHAVAEQALGLMLGLARNLYANSQRMRRGEWNKDGGLGLRECTIGVIGVGHVGKAVVQLLRPFGGRLLCHDIIDIKSFADKSGAEVASLDEVLAQSDILTMHVPLTPLTRHMINTKTLQQMKPGVILINTARGEVIDIDSLKQALKTGQVGGVGLDVFPIEPFKDMELIQQDNVICTPHTSGNSQEAVLAMGMAAIEGLRSLAPSEWRLK